MRILASAVALATALTAAAPASALTFLFSYSGVGTVLGAFSATGTLTTTDTTTLTSSGQAYTITDITGTRTNAGATSAITGLIAAGTDFGGVAIDNYLLTNTALRLTDAGFGFSVAGTTNLFNPYYVGGAYQEYVRSATNDDVQNTSNLVFVVTPVAAAVPEPASWALLISGFGLVGGVMRRRTKLAFSAA